ncbi:MAG: class I SAM-dependent methyltransferase [Flavobacteriia bacterium]|nr:class I SAM-dependent methyltransferase [Flavobacteriia bacterium]
MLFLGIQFAYLCPMSETEWYASWFDTSYYHLLYKHRNEEEAKDFMERLVDFLRLPPNAKVLDLACGKGRHARTLHALGLEVVGTDLSPQSIAFAQQFSTSGLQFQVHDMRVPMPEHRFDAVFNLFTSFGYFNRMEDNLRVVEAVHAMTAPNGIFVIDFLNAQRVMDTLVEAELVERGTITFHVRREILDGKVIKHIDFTDEGNSYHYTEQVQLLRLSDFQTLLQKHFNILHTFGDYCLNSFLVETSPRLILIAEKK